MYKIAIVLGTRPEVIKLAPLIECIQADSELQAVVISTGQQGDLLRKTLDEFEISPNIEIKFSSQKTSLTDQAGTLISEIGSNLNASNSSYVIIQGDTSSAFAGAVAGFMLKIPVGHVEAGLRSYDLSSPFPEEGYRSMISKVTTDHFAPTSLAASNLLAEGVSKSAIHLVGNTVVDSILNNFVSVNHVAAIKKILVTLHRRENFGEPLKNIASAIKRLALEEPNLQFKIIIHPNPNSGLVLKDYLANLVNIQLLEPLSYKDLLFEISTSHAVLTDSGGIQEECAVLQVNMLIARNETERPEVLSESRKLVGTNEEKVYAALKAEIDSNSRSPRDRELDLEILGDGQSSSRIARIIRASI